MSDLKELSSRLISTPWNPVSPGVSSQLLGVFKDKGWISVLRLEPGSVVPLHRHTGEVHGFVLAGHRRLGPGGALVGPGEYTFEPEGNVDTWSVEGDVPLVSLFVVRGDVEYLDDSRAVLRRETGQSKLEAYQRVCIEKGVVPADLMQR
ncbi:cupin domain-containing protein [Bradyrhizobium mercantei]|uniref:cupin domain-containing protein n=1 Tax=Bradyrhizobium mercantei TaxID=1904807 RepID=UPI000978849E|nr:cupin domain-containing protein [Bradyrhizobium mercantei]